METTEVSSHRALSLELVDGLNRQTVAVARFPFAIGRSSECGLVLSQAFVSRHHAEITREGQQFLLRDTKSRHGTFVNGKPVIEHLLRPDDVLQFGSLDGPELRLKTEVEEDLPDHTILERLQDFTAQGSDLEKLRWFLQAARELSSAASMDRVLASLLETTLALAKVERGYVFLMNAQGVLELALGRDASGGVLTDTSTLSRTVLRQAAEGNDQFIVTDTWSAEGTVAESIIAHSIRTIVCIPLRQRREARDGEGAQSWSSRQVFGALYLDSRFHPERVSEVDHELLRTIAREAAALVDNAQLAVIEDQARQHKEELGIAARIQQGLMAVKIPAFTFAEVQAYSVACSSVGGDFFDIISAKETLNVALVDVSGKGISAAILASTLQGMLFVQLEAQQPLRDIARATNKYLCNKDVGKYATMLLLRLHADGTLEYMNCGHIQPRVCAGQGISRLPIGNLPVGLLCEADYIAGVVQLRPGARVLLVSDGVTEAENPQGDFFGEDRLDSAALCTDVQNALKRVSEFCAGCPATDDVTVVQVLFKGQNGDGA